jgi:ketosteroid isomerase-like protein
MIRLPRFTKPVLWAVALCLAASSADAQGRGPACAPTDPQPVAAALREMFAAATVDDFARMRAVFTPDFYAFDGGRRFDGLGMAELIKGAHKSGRTLVWTVQKPDVHIACDTAWIAYVNRGSATDASGTQALTWLESAVLRFEGGKWRIAFFHSTRVPPAAP